MGLTEDEIKKKKGDHKWFKEEEAREAKEDAMETVSLRAEAEQVEECDEAAAKRQRIDGAEGEAAPPTALAADGAPPFV